MAQGELWINGEYVVAESISQLEEQQTTNTQAITNLQNSGADGTLRTEVAAISNIENVFTDVPLTWNNGGYWQRSDGALQSIAGWYYASEVTVSPGETYRLCGVDGSYSANLYVILNSSNQKLIAYPDQNIETGTFVNVEFTIPATGAILRINRYNNSQVYEIPHLSKVTSTAKVLSTAGMKSAQFTKYSDNLFNKYSAENVSGQFYYAGSISSNDAYWLSHKIPVSPGDSITTTCPPEIAIGTTAVGVYMDKDGNVLYQIANVTAAGSDPNKYYQFTVPNDANIKYMSLTIISPASFMAINGAYPAKYTAYDGAYRMEESFGLNLFQRQQAGDTLLYGKNLVYGGDSICYGIGTTGGYPKIISDNTLSFFQNRGLDGATLASGTSASRYVCTDVDNMDAYADLVNFEGGINDYWLNVPIGTIDLSSSTRFTETNDTTTFYGALDSIFRQAIAKWPGIPISFTIVHKIQNTEFDLNTQNKTFKDYRDAIIVACNKYSIPYLDLWLTSGFNCAIPSLANAFTVNGTTGDPDGCHPNLEGYNAYYVPQLIHFFKSLIKRETAN